MNCRGCFFSKESKIAQQDDVEKKLEQLEREFDRIASPEESIVGQAGVGIARRHFILKVVLSLCVLMVVLPPFFFPVHGVQTSGYFMRIRPEANRWHELEVHYGIDIAAPQGTPVRTTAPGRVLMTAYSEGWGNFVIVNHLLGLNSVYAHLDSIDVHEGQWVLPGVSRLGRVGMTGRATGPHLHFEIRFGNFSLPPRMFLLPHYLRIQIVGF